MEPLIAGALLFLLCLFIVWVFEGQWWAWLIALIIWVACHPQLLVSGGLPNG